MRRNRSPEYIFSSERPRHRGRRALLWLMGILLLLLIMIGAMNFVFNHQVTLARQSVTVQNLPEDLESWSILHISDLNGQEIGEGQSAIRKAIELRRYSCVVMTGDMVGKKGDVQPLLDLIALLPSDVPKMLVPGDNDPPVLQTTAHDSLSVYSDWAQAVQDAGVILLEEPVSFTRGKSTIWFVPEGLYSLDLNSMEAAYQAQVDGLMAQGALLTPDESAAKRAAEHQLNLSKRIREKIETIQDKDIQVVVTHTPLTGDYVGGVLQASGHEKAFSLRRAALVLAGHYTGGQWRLPWGGALYVPEYGWMPEDRLIMGLDYVGGVPQYISPGVGASDTSPFPGRLFNGPVVTLLTLTSRLS